MKRNFILALSIFAGIVFCFNFNCITQRQVYDALGRTEYQEIRIFKKNEKLPKHRVVLGKVDLQTQMDPQFLECNPKIKALLTKKYCTQEQVNENLDDLRVQAYSIYSSQVSGLVDVECRGIVQEAFVYETYINGKLTSTVGMTCPPVTTCQKKCLLMRQLSATALQYDKRIIE